MLEKYKDILNGNQKIKTLREYIWNTYSGRLEFKEDTHQYFLGGVEYDCVSNVTHRFKKHVDFGEICERKAARMGIPTVELQKQWDYSRDQACIMGTHVHEFGESYFYYAIGLYDRILPSCKSKFSNGILYPTSEREKAVVKFWEDLPSNYLPVLAETKVFSTELRYAGTFDILFYRTDPDPSKEGLVIFDYKTNTDLYKNFAGTKLLEPFSDLLDMPESLYKIQLSAYQIPLELCGLNVVSRSLIWLKPSAEYVLIELESYTDDLIKVLQ